MMLYACDACRFLFESNKENVIQCPDCGKKKVRVASTDEIKEFESRVLEEDDECFSNSMGKLNPGREEKTTILETETNAGLIP